MRAKQEESDIEGHIVKNIQKLKDTDWNNPKEITAKNIAKYLYSLIKEEPENANNTVEVKAPLFVVEKLNQCSNKRKKEIDSAIRTSNFETTHNTAKEIKSEMIEEYSSILADEEEENSIIKSLRATFKHFNISEECINYFLPPANDITNWDRKKQITKIAEAKIVASYLYNAQQEKDAIRKIREKIRIKTNQQRRNKTQYPTITQWNQELKSKIIQELTSINTPATKAKRIASKCVSVIKKTL